jgi:hypothetical protein
LSVALGLDAFNDSSCRLHRQLLTDDLEEKRAKEVHSGKLPEPCPRVEIRSFIDDSGKDRISVAEVGKGTPAAGLGEGRAS